MNELIYWLGWGYNLPTSADVISSDSLTADEMLEVAAAALSTLS